MLENDTAHYSRISLTKTNVGPLCEILYYEPYLVSRHLTILILFLDENPFESH
jgi:hypothetical protein